MDYISDRNEAAADRLEVHFQEQIARLADWPGIGRPGRVKGTRELVLHPNYVAIYQVANDAIVILRVLHARRLYP